MNKEEFIESILTEWSGKTISSNEHFMRELRMTLEEAIEYGRGIERGEIIMTQFNYNPFTWEPEEGQIYFYVDEIDSSGELYVDKGCWRDNDFHAFQLSFRKHRGIYKTEADASASIEIAREAILKNVKE